MAYEQEQFEDWSRDILSALSDSKSQISLQANNRVMDLDHVDGRLKIQYSDRLISLLREVRQFSALGFPIPAKIQQASNTGDKFYRQAIVLKQVAHFYNTIDQQMIPSQRPMMLSHALAFEQVIKNPHSQSKESGGKVQITWDNPKELEVYIAKLQSVAEKLSTENRKLRKWHTDFTDKVVTLMNVDLLKHKQQWKDGLQDLRTGFATLEAQGFRSDDMRAWRQHWNHQLYKALEHQYQTGLEALNKNLPEIHVDLTFNVLEVVAYEARRLFRHRLVSSKDLHSFDNILSSIIRGDWGSDALDNMTVPSGDINNISAYTTSAVSSGPTLPVSPGPSLAISSASSKALPLTPYRGITSKAPAQLNSLIQVYNPSRLLRSANEQCLLAQNTPGKTLQRNDPTMVERATKLCTLSKLTRNIQKTAENITLVHLPMHLNIFYLKKKTSLLHFSDRPSV
ncbi:cytoplasmic dynein 2 heavy chain 1-like isoform X1 [Channa argus]|uniref:cytoplasmic dynein 2 heavy chain 1-like isoform X1 n=1 Tax=Channa argus TaxID=215402 RepID=UPI003520EB44